MFVIDRIRGEFRALRDPALRAIALKVLGLRVLALLALALLLPSGIMHAIGVALVAYGEAIILVANGLASYLAYPARCIIGKIGALYWEADALRRAGKVRENEDCA